MIVLLNPMVLRQMAGRSGRRGFDLRGNLIFTGVPAAKIRRLLNSELPTLNGRYLRSLFYSDWQCPSYTRALTIECLQATCS